MLRYVCALVALGTFGCQANIAEPITTWTVSADGGVVPVTDVGGGDTGPTDTGGDNGDDGWVADIGPSDAVSDGVADTLNDTAGDSASDGDAGCHVPPCDPPIIGPQLPTVQTRFPRLTHLQWENTVRDLLHLNAPTGLVGTLINDTSTSSYSTNGASLKVGGDLWADYERVSRDLAALVMGDPLLLAGIVDDPSPATFDGPKTTFIENFGRRAFRRPLTTAEVNRYSAVFDEAAALLFSSEPFKAGIEMTIRSMLQSPYFLYRVETSTAATDALIPLTGFELATRLSYSLWNTMPTDVMLAKAGAGEFDTDAGVAAQIDLMLGDMRAQAMVASFHHEYLHTESFADIKKTEGVFADFLPTTGLAMHDEIEHFVLDLVFQSDGGFPELMTAPFTYVNENLANIYGISGVTGDSFQRVDLDPTQRSGVLTRLGFLAYNATLTQPDPIHRGVFVSTRMICVDLPAPPMNVPPVPTETAPTNRERVDLHTGKGTCGEGCHYNFINPAGFPFENYDAIGRWRTEDNGFPVNAADTYKLDGVAAPYNNAMEFSSKLAASLEVNRCYAQQWLEYLYGRPHTVADEPLLYEVAAASRIGQMSVREMIKALLVSPAYLNRAVDSTEGPATGGTP